MSFTDYFSYKDMRNLISDISLTIESWEEYNPSVCEEIDERDLEFLGKSAIEKLEEVQKILELMSDINKDSYGC